MRKFEYRSARFSTDIPLRYADSSCETSGVCTQVSPDGMEVRLADSPQVGNSGRIFLIFEDQTIEIEVRVAHVNEDRCGMKFVYKSERERKMMNELVVLARRARESSV